MAAHQNHNHAVLVHPLSRLHIQQHTQNTRLQKPYTVSSSSHLSHVSKIPQPRVIVHDENRITSTTAHSLPHLKKHETISKRSSAAAAKIGASAAFSGSIRARATALGEVTNIRTSNTIDPSKKQQQLKKTSLPIVLPDPTLSSALTRAQSMMAPAPHRPAPALVRASSTGTTKPHSSTSSIKTSFVDSTKLSATRTRKSWTRALETTPIQTQPQAQTQVQAQVQVKPPGAPKASAASRLRKQAPTAARVGSPSIQRPLIASQLKDASTTKSLVPTRALRRPSSLDAIRARIGQLIPEVPPFDSALYLDRQMDGILTGMAYAHDPLPEMALDSEHEQDEYDPDPSLVAEYQATIFAYKREMEIKLLPDPHYMDRQTNLTWHCRVRLIEWLVQVHDRFNLFQETIHLCVNYLDRFLSKIVIPLDQLQLAGTAALLLASKYEEIQSPAIKDLAYLGGNAYTPDRIRQAEIGMLRALNYDMGAPGPMSFLRRISRADNYDADIRTLAKYLIDITLCDHRFIGMPSSMVAAVGYCASMRLLFRGEWTTEHEYFSGYAEDTLQAGVNVLLTMLEQPAQTHESLFIKYQDEAYLHSSDYVQSLGVDQLRALRS
ncbi:hypothetical protein BG011_003649 [Mortierella polycephala]|uniref:Cyclin N-terminal domain-containing protein n=1 Tax=Mortierella polycephala TaxID=41804 RepID=A0A9P6U953_9FUNG|nr:hypothetical protein BG011_003649 [Mortierella polycephala]